MADQNHPQRAVLFRTIGGFEQEYRWPVGVASQMWNLGAANRILCTGGPMGWAAGLGALQACTATHSSSLANGHQRCNHRKHFQWPQLQRVLMGRQSRTSIRSSTTRTHTILDQEGGLGLKTDKSYSLWPSPQSFHLALDRRRPSLTTLLQSPRKAPSSNVHLPPQPLIRPESRSLRTAGAPERHSHLQRSVRFLHSVSQVG